MDNLVIESDIIEQSLRRKEKQIKKYFQIMDSFDSTDVENDLEFQKTFTGFYRIRRNKEFREKYYKLLSYAIKNKNITFEEILLTLKIQTERLEPSFSSKIIAIINPNMPIWDSIILKKLGKNPPKIYSKNREKAIIEIYNEIIKDYSDILLSKESKRYIEIFDQVFKNNNISDIKKIDFVLWSTPN